MAAEMGDKKLLLTEGRFVVEVPASTSNLGPGLECLALALDLFLRFEAHVGVDTTTVERPRDPFGEWVAPEDDFLVLGFRQAMATWGIEPPEVHFRVLEQPPIARGLGSSAAALVGGAALAEALLLAPVGPYEVAKIAYSIEGRTNNVCASALGGLVMTLGTRDGRVFVRQLRIHPMWKVACAVPNLPQHIELMRRVLPEMVPLEDAVANMSRALLLVHALLLGDVGPFPDFTADLLHQPYRSPHIPGFDSVIERARQAGAAGAFLSGSGTTIAALVPDEPESVADAMVDGFREAGVEAIPLGLSVVQRGYVVTRV